eukprot:COSAG02_NODE_187_length_30377_cov_3.636271_19_plen_178_part_00
MTCTTITKTSSITSTASPPTLHKRTAMSHRHAQDLERGDTQTCSRLEILAAVRYKLLPLSSHPTLWLNFCHRFLVQSSVLCCLVRYNNRVALCISMRLWLHCASAATGKSCNLTTAPTEDRTQFGMWAIVSSPLILVGYLADLIHSHRPTPQSNNQYRHPPYRSSPIGLALFHRASI